MSFASNQFAMSGCTFIRNDRSKLGGGIAFHINDQSPKWAIKIESPFRYRDPDYRNNNRQK